MADIPVNTEIKVDRRRYPRSEAVKEQLRNRNIGRKMTDEARANMRLASARKWSDTQWKNYFEKQGLDYTGDHDVGIRVRARELGITVDASITSPILRRKVKEVDPDYFVRKGERCRARRDKHREFAAGRVKPELCEICQTSEFKIVFDHCHTQGHFRGWICDRCNRVLGLMKDNVSWFKKITSYLENDNELTHDEKEKRTPDLRLCGFGSKVSSRYKD